MPGIRNKGYHCFLLHTLLSVKQFKMSLLVTETILVPGNFLKITKSYKKGNKYSKYYTHENTFLLIRSLKKPLLKLIKSELEHK